MYDQPGPSSEWEFTKSKGFWTGTFRWNWQSGVASRLITSVTHGVRWHIKPFTAPACHFRARTMHGHACRQYFFRSYNIYFQCHAFWLRSFHMPVWKRRQKGSRVSNFTLLWVIFKWYHGSEACFSEACFTTSIASLTKASLRFVCWDMCFANGPVVSFFAGMEIYANGTVSCLLTAVASPVSAKLSNQL